MIRSTHGRGFTLIELMIACVLLVIFCTITVQMGLRVRGESEGAEAYATDLQELRAALRTVAADVRAAQAVARTEDSLLVAGADGTARFTVRDGALVRVSAGGDSRRVARSVAALETVTRGDLVTVSLRLRRRSESGVPAAAVTTQVRLRAGAGGVR